MIVEFDKAPTGGLRLSEAAEQWCDPELVEQAKESLRQWVDAGGSVFRNLNGPDPIFDRRRMTGEGLINDLRDRLYRGELVAIGSNSAWPTNKLFLIEKTEWLQACLDTLRDRIKTLANRKYFRIAVYKPRSLGLKPDLPVSINAARREDRIKEIARSLRDDDPKAWQATPDKKKRQKILAELGLHPDSADRGYGIETVRKVLKKNDL